LPLKAQVGLLRFLQDGKYRPLGGQREEKSDVRIVAACNRSLEDEVKSGRFRCDLYYRLNLLSIDVPPLRARREDIPLLSRHFLRECAHRYSSRQKGLHSTTLTWLSEYGGPATSARWRTSCIASLFCEDQELRIAEPGTVCEGHLHSPAPPSADLCAGATHYRVARARALEQFDRAYLSRVLTIADGNVTKAAALAGKETPGTGQAAQALRHFAYQGERSQSVVC
jgi:two-component system, NtrC family, response regulator GlrR